MSSADAGVHDRLQQALGGAYTIGRELGGGGMSRVFVADEQALGRKVVVKVLRPDLAEGLSAERFKREVRLAARLQHPHIVPLLAALEMDGGALYYTMPYVEGESLRARLTREGGLPVAEAVRIARDVASALAYAHGAGVVHRDVKPENILLSHGGAVVADFGIARAVSASREGDGGADPRRSSTLTAAGTSLGTPAYMAPEQAAGDAVDHRADLYALGVVAYEMLAGSAPFEGRTAQQLLAAHATQAPEPLARRRPSASPALAALVMRMLEKQPADRPQSADEVLRAIDALAGTGAHFSTDAAGRDRAGEARGDRARARAALPAWLPWAAALAGVGLAAYLALAPNGGTVSDARGGATVTATLLPPPGTRVSPWGLAVSPDGTRLAFAAQGADANGRLFVRPLDTLDATPLAGTEGARWPFWSPDGQSIGFFADGQLKVVRADGAGLRALCAAPAPYACTTCRIRASTPGGSTRGRAGWPASRAACSPACTVPAAARATRPR